MLIRVDPRAIKPPRNDREARDPVTIQKLSASILKVGLLQPLRVFRNEDAKLEMLCGETRRLAAIMAGLTEIDAVVREGSVPTTTEMLLERWSENMLHEKEKPSDQVAIALGLLKENADWTYLDLGECLGISEASVSRLLRPFTLLPETARTEIDKGSIRPSYAYYLSRIAHLPEELDKAIRMIMSGKIKKRDALVRHVGGILNQTPSSKGATHDFESFKVICKDSRDPTLAFRFAEATKRAALRMKQSGQNSMDDFWQLVVQYFTGNGGDHVAQGH